MSSIIGTFSNRPSGGLAGMVRTLQFQGQIDWMPNSDSNGETDPDLIGYVGDIQIGRAYERTTRDGESRTYYRAILDDPSFTRPVSGNIVRNGEGWDFIFSRRGRQD